MPNLPLLKRINSVRRDLGNLLFHFTRGVPADKDLFSGTSTPAIHPQTNLEQILKDGALNGSSRCIKGGHKCVCFTEAPISEMVSLFNLALIEPEGKSNPRYEPFGIAVTKKWLFSKGGRPVIYQPSSEYDALPQDLQYRHVTYDPIDGIDFTWEREWRVCTESLCLDPKETIIIVPEAQIAFTMMYEYSRMEVVTEDGWVAHEPIWMVVSLDFFGLWID